MKKSILITGIAGTGKTSIISFLQQQGYTAYSIEDIKGICRMIYRETGETVPHEIAIILRPLKNMIGFVTLRLFKI